MRSLLPALFLVLGMGCSEEGGPDSADLTPPTSDPGPPPLTDQEEQLLSQLDGAIGARSTWGQAPGWEGIVQSWVGAHGSHVAIHYNDVALASLDLEAPGAVAFKDAYDDAEGTQHKNITALLLDAEYGWFYAMYEPDGTLDMAGRIGFCMNCHENEKASDQGFLAP